jgi:hypothetical protein
LLVCGDPDLVGRWSLDDSSGQRDILRNGWNFGTHSMVLNTIVQLTAPAAVGQRVFVRWADEKGATLSEDNALVFFFDHSTMVTAEYQSGRSFYLNDWAAEADVEAGDDAADDRWRAGGSDDLQASGLLRRSVATCVGHNP